MAEAGTLKEQTANLNATFPCGDPEAGQRCKIPFEFCDVIMGSCTLCNVDICREKSRPSCNIYCDDTKIQKEATVTLLNKSTSTPSLDFKIAFYVTLAGMIACFIAITDLFIIVYKQRKRGPLVTQPVDQ